VIHEESRVLHGVLCVHDLIVNGIAEVVDEPDALLVAMNHGGNRWLRCPILGIAISIERPLRW